MYNPLLKTLRIISIAPLVALTTWGSTNANAQTSNHSLSPNGPIKDFTLISRSNNTKIKFQQRTFNTTDNCITAPYSTKANGQYIRGQMCLKRNTSNQASGTFTDINRTTNEGCQGRATITRIRGKQYHATWTIDGTIKGYKTCTAIGQTFRVNLSSIF